MNELLILYSVWIHELKITYCSTLRTLITWIITSQALIKHTQVIVSVSVLNIMQYTVISKGNGACWNSFHTDCFKCFTGNFFNII